MAIKSFILFCYIILLCSCDVTHYLPGFNFQLFRNTPVWKLAKAVEKDDTKELYMLLENSSVNIDYQEPKFGHTLLMLAVANNRVKSVEILLNYGANPNVESKERDDTAVSVAAEDYSDVCDTTILNLLVRYGGNVNFIRNIDRVEDNGMRTMVKQTTLMIAARRDCYEIVKCLVDNGANIDKYTHYEGYGAITEALIQDNLKIVRYFIIEKQAKIPSYIFKRIVEKGEPDKYVTIKDMLNERSYEKGSENYNLREEILNYLEGKKRN